MYSREPGVAGARPGPPGMRQAVGGAEEREGGQKSSWPGHPDLGSPAAQAEWGPPPISSDHDRNPWGPLGLMAFFPQRCPVTESKSRR